MHKNTLTITILFVVFALFAAACSPSLAALPAEVSNVINSVLDDDPVEDQHETGKSQSEHAPVAPIDPGLLAAYESTLINIYEQVNPSVVNIRVVQEIAGVLPDSESPGFEMPDLPEGFELPEGLDPQQPYGQGLGSGFVWDTAGNIVTNNHVVEGADKIEVTFSDETVAIAELVGADPDSDLAVIHVDLPADQLQPVKVGDSDTLRVGQLAIAIGNPFGLEGTMTVGIVSALGRSLPASSGLTGGPVFSIPNIIQTDAPINPGNSGGVLLDDMGEVIGVTAAIESPVRANAGVGFVIPSSIVERVIPSLIANGSFAHPYLGISGISLSPDLAEAMQLETEQRGILVAEVLPDGPAEKAGLLGSSQQASIDGVDFQVGGDVITVINGQVVEDMDDLISYLSSEVEVGQTVVLALLRDGKEIEIEVILEARPERRTHQAAVPEQNDGRAWLGIVALPVTPEIAEAMDLPADQIGVLIEQVQAGSPAEEVGLQGSDKPVTINDEDILVGGDVITAVDGEKVASVQELAAYLQEVGAGGEVTLSLIRDGTQITVNVTLSEQS
ncbi:MAG: trypsin-like peptidase domain-containing protein [Anaerolineales bacterium]